MLRPHRYAHVSAECLIPTVSCLTLGEKQADMQTFQVFKT